MLFSASVFPEVSPMKHVEGSKTEKLQGRLCVLQLQFIRSGFALYTCVSQRGQDRGVKTEGVKLEK